MLSDSERDLVFDFVAERIEELLKLCRHDVDSSLELWQTVTDVMHQQLTSATDERHIHHRQPTPSNNLVFILAYQK